MTAWFTVEPIDADTFAISEYRHWEQSHSYLVCGTDAAALIDTGLGVEDIRKTVRSLTDLPVKVLTTHAHWDHIGGHAQFADIAVHSAERAWLSGQFPLPLAVVKAELTKPPCDLPQDFSPDRYCLYAGGAQTYLHDGDRVPLGGRTLTVLHTPGHSPGHCCFYDDVRRYLFSGDLLYAGTLDAFYPSTDPVQFAASVRRIAGLPLCRILPGHYSLSLPVTLARAADDAFSELERSGKLQHGAGIFDFGAFSIRL